MAANKMQHIKSELDTVPRLRVDAEVSPPRRLLCLSRLEGRNSAGDKTAAEIRDREYAGRPRGG